MRHVVDCPACGRANFTLGALRVHYCPTLNRERMSIEQWVAAVTIEVLKKQMMVEGSQRRLRELRDDLVRLGAMFPRDQAAAAAENGAFWSGFAIGARMKRGGA